ncbi:hypothetical protein J3Q64DRAFT_1719543 [Phycomyces blakesleeanus]|uniref:Uncharacterized protein n=1 Tax=Phycomyces blakesleeanus TaxID=4837 RepID=A0ABR3B9A8_PHYBL
MWSLFVFLSFSLSLSLSLYIYIYRYLALITLLITLILETHLLYNRCHINNTHLFFFPHKKKLVSTWQNNVLFLSARCCHTLFINMWIDSIEFFPTVTLTHSLTKSLNH